MAVLAGSLFFSGCGGNELSKAHDANEVVSYISTASRLNGLDPATSSSVDTSIAISRIYEGLLEYDYLARPYKVIPSLAAAMPEVSEDGLVYTFKIREGIYFQDDPCFPGGKGRELVARDFEYSFKRLADAKNKSPGFWTISSRIKGIDDFNKASQGAEETDYDLPVSGLKCPDARTFQITLTEPYPQLPYILTMHYTFAVPREAVEMYEAEGGEKITNHPVGTGPYRLVEWRRNSRVEFERNPKWAETGRVETYPTEAAPELEAEGLLKDAGKQIPFNDRIIHYIIDKPTTSWMMFLSGQLGISTISSDDFDVVVTPSKEVNASMEKRGIKLTSAPRVAAYYIGFNWDDSVVGYSDDPARHERNKKLRQALSCAYEFDQINTFMNNRLYPLGGPIPTPLAGNLAGPSPYDFNLEKARKLLAEAGYPGGVDSKTGRRLELTIDLGGADTSTRQQTELYADMFQKIGVVLKPNYNTWPAFTERLNRRQSQLFRLAWVADYPDAENFLALFYGNNASPGPNHANYRNAEIDRLYEKVRVMQDSPERTALYEQMARIIVEDSPWIFMYQPMSFAVTHSWVENYIPHDYPYGLAKFQGTDVELREKWLKSYGDKKLDMAGQE